MERSGKDLTERKVLRRGLIGGLAAMGGATLLTLTGVKRASAADNGPLLMGVNTNASTLNTRLTMTTSGTDAVLTLRRNAATVSTANAALVGLNDGGASSAGVVGLNHGAAGVGVLGSASIGIGVRGFTSSVTGVQGETLSGIGVRGVSSGNTTGVKGVSNASGTPGVEGDGSGIGVHGKSGSGNGVLGESTNAAGVMGTSVNQPGVEGTSTNSLGIRGNSTNFVGVVGISAGNHGLYGSSSGPNSYGIVAENLVGGRGLLVTGNQPSQIFGGLQVFGAKNAVLKMNDGSFASVYSQESPEPFFEDFGRAQLTRGVATVQLEREYAELVAGGDYMVTLTPEGASSHLFVSSRTPASFEVREGNNGMSNVSFTYRIVTRRKDIEGKRFARVSVEAAKSVASARAQLTATAPTANNAPTFVPPLNNVVPNTTPQQPAPTATEAPPATPPQPGPAGNGRGG